MLYYVIASCEVIYLRIVTHAHADLLTKGEQVFMELPIFYLRKNASIESFCKSTLKRNRLLERKLSFGFM